MTGHLGKTRVQVSSSWATGFRPLAMNSVPLTHCGSVGRSLCIERGINYFNVWLHYGRTLVEARLEELIPTIANIQATEYVSVHAS